MWAGKTAIGQYAPGASCGNPVDVDDEDCSMQYGKSSGSKNSGKRSTADWRDDDPSGVVKQKTGIADSVKESLDTGGRLNQELLKTLQEDHLAMDIGQLNDEVMSFDNEVEIGTLIKAIDILLGSKEMAFS